MAGSRDLQRCSRRNKLICHASMLNERAGQFYKAVHCKVTRHLKTHGRIGLETDDLARKQKNFGRFGVRCFDALNVRFHSNVFIKKCPSITLSRNNIFHSLSKKLFSCSAVIFVGLVESCRISECAPSTLPVMIFLKSHTQPCGHHSTLKKAYGQSARFVC